MTNHPASGSRADERPLEGCRVLIVEDEYFQAREIALALRHAGSQVIGPVARAGELGDLAGSERIDAALLDINLGEGASFEVARSMQARGVPFLFLTGYDVSIIPEELSRAPRLEKPVDQELLVDRLARLVRTQAS